MEGNPDEEQVVCWHSTERANDTQANVHYITGGMVLGVAAPVGTSEIEILDALKDEFDTDLGYITYEQPPLDNAKESLEFVAECRKKDVNRKSD